MGKTLTFLATRADLPMITGWLEQYSPVVINGRFDELPYREGRTLIIHFPSIGPLNYWPDEIRITDYKENSSEWRQAILLLRRREEERKREIHANTSAVAGFDPPYQMDEGPWVTGDIWFPQENLSQRFPKLVAINRKLERFIAKQELVFDNTKTERFEAFPQLFCGAGVQHRVYAFPDALHLMHSGQPMVDSYVSPTCRTEFLRRLQLQGIVANKPLDRTR
jgi:hypothetical protein